MLLRDAHPGYISWAEHERIEDQLHAGMKALGWERRQGPPREGPALLQGRVVCGLCGSRMQIRYRPRRGGQLVPDYVCPGRGRGYAEPLCQSILGTEIDAAVGQLLVEAVTPMALELALAVQQEIQSRLNEADRLRHRQVERAQYDADRARYRYMQVDPANRLVADSLEADWNGRLRALAEAQEEYERQRTADRVTVDPEHRARILALAVDVPTVWRDPNTPQRERKRMLALLVEDVTLLKQRQVTAHVRFRGGATTTLTLPRPLTAWELRAFRRGDERAAGRVHRRSSRRGPQRARPTDWRRGGLRCGERAVGPILSGPHEPQATPAGRRHAHRPADRCSARRPSDHHRPMAGRGTPRGAHLQRDGPVAVRSRATTSIRWLASERNRHARCSGHLPCRRCSMKGDPSRLMFWRARIVGVGCG